MLLWMRTGRRPETDGKYWVLRSGRQARLKPVQSAGAAGVHFLTEVPGREMTTRARRLRERTGRMKTLYEQAKQAAEELLAAAKLQKGDLLVVGCSSSEITGSKIGTDSRPETAEEVFSGIYGVLREKGIFLAAQCCEHLNRSLVVEAAYAEAHCLPSRRRAVPSLPRLTGALSIPSLWRRSGRRRGWISAAPSSACT